jgi:hypothetical protein
MKEMASMKKLCLFLSIVLVVLALPACGQSGSPDILPKYPTASAQPKLETRHFGAYDWLVLSNEDGKILLLTKDVIESRKFHETEEAITWADSDLRRYLNGEFLKTAFSEAERAKLVPANCDNSGVEDFGNGSNAPGGPPTQDTVFLLSYQEAEYYFSDNEDRAAALQGDESHTATTWWLRSPSDYLNGFASVGPNGQVQYGSSNVHFGGLGVRPAVWVSD